MRKLALIMTLFTSAAHAHESLVPHAHPHGVSMLSGVEVIGAAALVLALAVIAIARFKSR
jgi:hypothetical protein